MKIVAKNRRARFDYDISERFVAGLSLTGSEVKSAKAGQVNLRGSFITARRGELYLMNTHFAPYRYAAASAEADPRRPRKLLLHRREIDQLAKRLNERGLAVIPLALGLERGLIKLELGLGRGKKHYDKRETIRRRELAREADRAVKDRSTSS